MRTVPDQLAACLNTVGPLPALEVLLPQTVDCVLAEDIVAPFDLPVTDLATRDGYAVRSADCASASRGEPVILQVIDEVLAGSPEAPSLVEGAAIWIASGAPIPSGADAVVALPNTNQGETEVEIYAAPRRGANILPRATDMRADSPVLARGERIGARQVALAAAVGQLRVKVHPKPRVVIVSVGNELVEPGHTARPGTVFDANGHALSTAAADAGAETFRVAAVPDEHRALREEIEDQLVRADLIITTGGLSYGRGDTVKDVLSPLGTVRFDNIAMAPVRQIGAGTVGENTPIFCLPGNPVAAQIAFEVFLRPAIRSMAGWKQLYKPAVSAQLKSSWKSPVGRREFVHVEVSGNPAAGYSAERVGRGFGLLLSEFAASNALAVVPEDVTEVKVGDTLTCMLLDEVH